MPKPFKVGSMAGPGLAPGSCCGTCKHLVTKYLLLCCNEDCSYQPRAKRQSTGWWYRHTVPAWGWCPSFEFNGSEIVRTGNKTRKEEA